MESIETSGKNIDAAVQQALVRLARRRDEVEIAVLQEPIRGTFGLGAKDALVRVTVHTPAAVITPEMADALLGSDTVPEEEPYSEDEAENEFEDDEGEASELGENPIIPEEALELNGPTHEDVEITVDVVQHILHDMNIPATIRVRSTDPLILNIQGIRENLGLLIGRRGETLAALQLLVSLIVRNRIQRHIRITIDVENYREQREENLRSLAQRVAQQVRNYRRSIALEAMSPYERRIVHLALAESKDISTESIGEGEARRVVISLKRSSC